MIIIIINIVQCLKNDIKKPIGVFETYLINLFLLTRKYRYARN